MLTDKSNRSDTGKLWAERELDWPHHLWVVSQMVPYLFALVNVNYASYILPQVNGIPSNRSTVNVSGGSAYSETCLWCIEFNLV